MTIVARIPGEPMAQARPRARVHPRGFAQVYEPAECRRWKADARVVLERARGTAGLSRPLAGPVECEVLAVFTCPLSTWRKTKPRTREPHTKRPDVDNVAKLVLDAATGVLWLDDGQVSDLRVRKITGAQGEAPFVQLTVTAASVPAPAPAASHPQQGRLL